MISSHKGLKHYEQFYRIQIFYPLQFCTKLVQFPFQRGTTQGDLTAPEGTRRHTPCTLSSQAHAY